jgi:hypothetical protein
VAGLAAAFLQRGNDRVVTSVITHVGPRLTDGFPVI